MLSALIVLVTVCLQANAQDGSAKANKPTKNEVAERAGKHRLVTDDGTTLGRVSAGTGKPGDVIRWQPVDMKEGFPLTNAGGKIILSADIAQPEKSGQTNWPDRIFFKNNDTIPCRIVSIDQQMIVFESSAEKDRVSQDLVKAVELSRLGVSGAVSCEDAGWYFSDEARRIVGKNSDTDAAVEVTGENEMIIRARGRFGHSDLASPGTLSFNLNWIKRCHAELEVRHFVRSPDATSNGTGALLRIMDNGMIIYNLKKDLTNASSFVRVSSRKAKITIEVKEATYSVSVNGKPVYSSKINPAEIKGKAVSMYLSAFRTDDPTHVALRDIKINQTGLGESSVFVDSKNLEHLLTIPRLRKDNPPKQILFGRNFDLLRGELLALDSDSIQFESRLENFTFDRDMISSIVWLHPKTSVQLQKEQAAAVAETETLGEGKDANRIADQVVQVVLQDGRRITINAKNWTDKTFEGSSDIFGNCRVSIADIKELRMGKAATDATDIAYSNWIAKPARAPKFQDASEGGGSEFGKNSSLVGTQAKDFKMKLLDGSLFKLSEQRGKVVVLDFWATWCSPCFRAMPEMIKATGSFDPNEVVFIAVNQLEDPKLIQSFLKRQDWQMKVGLDNGDVASLFNVRGIPQSVIIDKDGKIAFLEVGSKNDLQSKMSKAIQHVLDDGMLKELVEEPAVSVLPAIPGRENQ